MTPADGAFSTARHVVTGAFGFTGRAIARALVMGGERVKTLTRRVAAPHPFGERLVAAPLRFDNAAALTESLRGAEVLYNTYWVRFPYGGATFEGAVANTRILLSAARAAGVRRVVHISVTGASEESPLPYFRGKGAVEGAVRASGLSYAILRPALIFGPGDVLINNIAWFLRRFPIFAVPGRGDYRVQPIFVDDLAASAVQEGRGHGDGILDLVGPETFTFRDLVALIGRAVGRRPVLVSLPARAVMALSTLFGYLVHDVVLTPQEITGLMANLLATGSPPIGATRLSEWLRAHGAAVGTTYASELVRHYQKEGGALAGPARVAAL